MSTSDSAPRSSAKRPDIGIFGPESVTWQVHANPVLWVGGLRALLLQALHPVAMAGIAQHSSFRSDPWGRLIRTANYIGVATFGTTPRNYLIGTGVKTVSFSLLKNFAMPYADTHNLQVRFEAFNALNTPQLSNPGASFGASSFS